MVKFIFKTFLMFDLLAGIWLATNYNWAGYFLIFIFAMSALNPHQWDAKDLSMQQKQEKKDLDALKEQESD